MKSDTKVLSVGKMYPTSYKKWGKNSIKRTKKYTRLQFDILSVGSGRQNYYYYYYYGVKKLYLFNLKHIISISSIWAKYLGSSFVFSFYAILLTLKN